MVSAEGLAQVIGCGNPHLAKIVNRIDSVPSMIVALLCTPSTFLTLIGTRKVISAGSAQMQTEATFGNALQRGKCSSVSLNARIGLRLRWHSKSRRRWLSIWRLAAVHTSREGRLLESPAGRSSVDCNSRPCCLAATSRQIICEIRSERNRNRRSTSCARPVESLFVRRLLQAAFN